jgi:hypothetical protein
MIIQIIDPDLIIFLNEIFGKLLTKFSLLKVFEKVKNVFSNFFSFISLIKRLEKKLICLDEYD